MDINVESITYQLELVTETGMVLDLTPSLLDLQWEWESNELAGRITVTVANMRVGSTWLMNLAKIGCYLTVFANWGTGNEKMCTGQIWEWKYLSSSQKEMMLTAFDPLKYLQQSYDYSFYSSGQSTSTILNHLCGQWGVSLSYQWSKNIVHGKKVFSNRSISDMVLTLLEEVRQKTGVQYACQWKEGALCVQDIGRNGTIYKFDEMCTISTSDLVSIHDLVTKVKIVGNADDEGRTYVEGVVNGDQSFGVIQKIMVRHNQTTLGEVMAEANVFINDNDKPEEKISVVAIDVPFLSKGDRVTLSAGNLVDDFYLTGVCHNGTNRQMTMTLKRWK